MSGMAIILLLSGGGGTALGLTVQATYVDSNALTVAANLQQPSRHPLHMPISMQ